MANFQNHLRKTFLTGIFAVVPVAATIFVVYWIDANTRIVSEKIFGRSIPFLGLVIAIVSVYLAGLIVTSLVGRFFVRLIDKLLSRVPILKELYSAWKQVALTPEGTEGTYSKVVLIPADGAKVMRLLGFTSGKPIDSAGSTLCVFVPQLPNPISGRLYFVAKEACEFVDVSPEDAFKILLSTGNYVPSTLIASETAAVRS
jgi:uncharacterized membrane protein